MKGADRKLACQCFQRDRRLLLQQTAGGSDFLYLLLLRIAVFRLAAFARAKACRLRGIDIRIEANIFRSARRERQDGRQQTPVVSTAKTN